MIVSSSDWTDYTDTIKHRESRYYCMISDGWFINIPKPSNINEEYGDECVIVILNIHNLLCIISNILCRYADYLHTVFYAVYLN